MSSTNDGNAFDAGSWVTMNAMGPPRSGRFTGGGNLHASLAYTAFKEAHPGLSPPKKKVVPKKNEGISRYVRGILQSFCEQAGDDSYTCGPRSIAYAMERSSNLEIVKFFILRLLQGETGLDILKEYHKDPVAAVIKDIDLISQPLKIDFWKCVSEDKVFQKECTKLYAFLKSARHISSMQGFTYLYLLTKCCTIEELSFMLKCFKSGCDSTGLRFLSPESTEKMHYLDVSELEILLTTNRIRWGVKDQIAHVQIEKSQLGKILRSWPLRFTKKKVVVKEKNKALAFLTQGVADSEWKITRKLKGIQSSLGSLDPLGIAYLFILSGVKVRDIYEMYRTNPLPLGNLLIHYYNRDRNKRYKADLYTKWAVEEDKETGLKQIIKVGVVEKGDVKKKLDFMSTDRGSSGILDYQEALLSPVLSLSNLKILRDRGKSYIRESTMKALLERMKESSLVFLFGWTPGGMLSMPSNGGNQTNIIPWYEKINSKLLKEAGTPKLDAGLGVLVTPLISFGSKQWDPLTSVPNTNKKLNTIYDQVTLLRPSSGAAVWLDKKKRVFESGADGSRYSFTHGSHMYRGTTILGASSVGYKEDELKGWIHISVSGNDSGGVLILPDKDWDSMSFLFERGLYFTPQAPEHRGLNETKVPSQNGYRSRPCFGGLEDSDPFRAVNNNQACAAACLMFATSNSDLTKRGTMGYAFPDGYIQRGMGILQKKIEKIPSNDIAVSIMSKTVMYDMGCVCVKYGKKANKGFIAAPVLEDKDWNWNTIGTFEVTDPVSSFPGSILRPAGILNQSGHLRGRRPIGGYMPYDKDGVMLGTKLRLCGYEKYLNAYKPLKLGIIDDGYDNEDEHTEVMSARNCSDKTLRGLKANRNHRELSKMKEWRKL